MDMPRSVTLVLLALAGAVPASAANFAPPEEYATGSAPGDVRLADVNRDGTPDLLTADRDGDTVSVRLGTGDGTFGAAAAVPVPAGPTAIAVADFDADGNADLAVAGRDADAVSVLFGDGTGGFSAPQRVVTAKGPQWVAAGDLNGDGVDDLVTSDGMPPAEAVRVALAGPGRTFVLAGAHPIGNQPAGGVATDLDGDGRTDVAVASRTEDRVYLLRGDGQGGFTAPTTHPAGRHPVDVLPVDVDADGILDLVTANHTGDDLTVLPGLGGGSFGAPVAHAAGPKPTAVIAGDFDADCVADLAVSLWGSDRVAVLAGDGQGGFGPARTFPAGTRPHGLARADLDGNLQADLVAAAEGSDRAVVLRGNAGAACSTFVVRRAGDPAVVRTALPRANPAGGPWNDAPGTRTDSEAYFYVIEHAGGLPAVLSVHPDPTDDSVRLGFNDGDALSAPVDPVLSTVAADAASAPADGVTAVTVAFTPRDGNGVPLGSGLAVDLDAAALAPAIPAGAIRDTGSGVYSVDVVASAAGMSTVLVRVEGVPLSAAPTIEFTTP